jgi:hypothetical protein
LGKRNMYDDGFKARVELEVAKGKTTITWESAQFKVHPNQILKLKKYLLENVVEIFFKKKDPKIAEQEVRVHQSPGCSTPAKVHLGQLALRAG